MISHLTSTELRAETYAARREGRIISDRAAVTIASYWQSPGTVGRHLAALASGADVDLADVLADISATEGEVTDPDDLADLALLRRWADSKCEDCSEEYGPCERHGEQLAQREGASARTADELCAVFILDARDVGATVTDDDVTLAESVEGWLDDPDAADALRDVVSRVESTLPAGVFTYWEDGYRIVRLTGGPLVDPHDSAEHVDSDAPNAQPCPYCNGHLPGEPADPVDVALQAFWQAIATAHPEITTGDLDPASTYAFEELARSTVRRWLELNR